MPEQIRVTDRIAASEAGTAWVTFGNNQMIAIVNATIPSIQYSGAPCRKTNAPSAASVLKLPSCAIPITIASPLTKPSITEWGTMRISFPNRPMPIAICMMPHRITVGNRKFTPCCMTKVTITTAIAPVAPEIIPGRPPTIAVIKPRKNAEYKPMTGSTPATKANAIASGTSARATVNPDRTSLLMEPERCLK